MGPLAGGRDIEIATALLIDTLACLKRADAPDVAEHVLEALRKIEDDFGIVVLDTDTQTNDRGAES